MKVWAASDEFAFANSEPAPGSLPAQLRFRLATGGFGSGLAAGPRRSGNRNQNKSGERHPFYRHWLRGRLAFQQPGLFAAPDAQLQSVHI